jgi:hypothetical protein
MSFEICIAGSEDRPMDGLHFGSRNGASCTAARRPTTFSPPTTAPWKPSGVRPMNSNLADVSGCLDGGTMRLSFAADEFVIYGSAGCHCGQSSVHAQKGQDHCERAMCGGGHRGLRPSLPDRCSQNCCRLSGVSPVWLRVGVGSMQSLAWRGLTRATYRWLQDRAC